MEARPKVDRFSKCHLESKRFRDAETTVPNPFSGAPIERPWYYYDRMAKGFQWDFLAAKSSWASWPVKNMIHMAIEGYTTMLTDNEPLVSVVPREESDTEEAEIVKRAVEYWWTDLESMQVKTAMAVKSSRTYGIGWLQTYRDEDHPHIGVRSISAEHVWVDPDCTVEDYDPNWVVYEYRAQVGELEARYPTPAEGTWDDFDPKWRSGVATDRVERKRYEDNRNPAKSCAVYEFWHKDDTRVQWDDEKSIPGKVVKKSKKANPGGVRKIIAGGILLEDKPNPYDHGECNLTPVHCYPVPGQFTGIGDCQNLMSIQTMRNRMSQFIFDQTVKAGGGKILIGQQFGTDPAKINNAPNQIVPCRDPNAYRVVAPLSPSRHVFDYISMLDNDGQDVMGLHDVSQGGTLPSHTTAQAVQAMTQSDRTRVRMASRWLTWALRRVLRQVIADWAQWPDFKWLLAISGKDEVPDSTSDTGTSVPPVVYKEFDPKVLKSKFTKDKLRYDIAIADTSTLPALQQDRNNQVAMWLQLGIVTPEAVLKYRLIEIPHSDAILADMQGAQQAAQQAPQGPPQGPPQAQPPMGQPSAQLPPEAVQPVPPGMPQQGEMTPEEFMAAIEEMAGQMGVTPESLVAQMTAQMGGQGGQM